MTALGTYLVVSLFFVISTLIEFGLVLEIKQNCGKTTNNALRVREGINVQQNKVDKLQTKKGADKNLTALELTAAKASKVDRFALFAFPIIYLFFNLVYWGYFLH